MKKTLVTMTALAAAAAACDATSAPSELDRARVLAVQIAPPRLGPEESAATEVLVGRADGTVSVVAPNAIEVTGAPPGSPASGMVARGPDGWSIACPDAEALAAMRAALGLAADEPIPVALAVEVAVDGELLPASKVVFLGSEGDNPRLAGITAEGAREEDGVLVAAVGDQIAIAAEGAAGEGELSYAWFTALGDIDLYLSEAATLTAGEAGTGPLVLVVRDPQGGVTWAWRELRIE